VAQCWVTEALGVTHCTMPPGVADQPFDERLGHKLRQGRIAFTTKLRIVDGKILPRDGDAFGHLQARGPCIAGAYLKQDAPTTDGWL
jgi:hypothetical protein